ncbi:MAG: redoxin domain-containing protein [Ruminococcaceae bacterium]|nr:redoxin domain-containing protein [Oscillospiraceae bacterium]
MKQTKTMRTIISLLLLVSMLFSILCSCSDKSEDNGNANGNGNPTDQTPPTDDPGSGDQTPTQPGSKVKYKVKVLSAGGLPLEGVTVRIYADNTLEDLVDFAETDADGSASLTLARKSSYAAYLTGVPDGYELADSYAITSTETTITLTSSIIKDESLAGVSYKLGSVMHDFSVVARDGQIYKLSEMLKEKKAVMLNFWFTTCAPCQNEFPYMAQAYEKYKDDIEILAMNHMNSEDDIDFFEMMYGLDTLPFPKVKDTTQMKNAFGIENYPTSVIIDRYGVICLIEAGGLPSAEPFEKAFEYFSSDSYVQKLFTNFEELTPIEKPTEEMPSSDEIAGVLNGGEIEVTYRPESGAAAEDTWPFVIGEKDGVACIKNSNAGKSSTFAIMYADITLAKGQALAIDYFSSTELGADKLIVIVDGQDIYQISGVGSAWETCYPYVATEDGTHEVAFAYVKDSTTNEGEDTIYLKNLRVISTEQIDAPTYIPRDAATNPDEFGFSYQDYITPVFNEKDGYYHVGDKNGPLLLADLMGITKLHTSFGENTSIYIIATSDNGIVLNGKNYYADLLDYFSYASNSEMHGFCTVNAELKELLEIVAEAVGLEKDNPNEWLQMCIYYDAYGTNGAQLQDPIRGLADFSAFEAKEGKNNSVTYNRVIMPRGLLYKFVPAKSGAYRITSDSEHEVNGWIFTAEGLTADTRTPIYTFEGGERMYNDKTNCSMVIYMEAGKEYYIDIAYYDVYQTGTFTFEIKRLGASYDLFTVASPGFFTYHETSGTGAVNKIIAGGIDVVLGSDGYYHEKLANGKTGSILYADFVGLTNIFSHSLTEMINMRAFDFSLTEGDLYILNYISQFYKELGIEAGSDPAEHRDQIIEKFKALWGETYAEYDEMYLIDDVISGNYHGDGEDMTAIARKYANQIDKSSATERNGCVKVNKELADLLQMLMDKYTFEGVDTSWRKLCYYYQHFGA